MLAGDGIIHTAGTDGIVGIAGIAGTDGIHGDQDGTTGDQDGIAGDTIMAGEVITSTATLSYPTTTVLLHGVTTITTIRLTT